MAKTANTTKTNVFIHENCGGEIKGVKVFKDGKLKNIVRCQKCLEEKWKIKDFNLAVTTVK